jgi:hypothetical protein
MNLIVDAVAVITLMTAIGDADISSLGKDKGQELVSLSVSS